LSARSTGKFAATYTLVACTSAALIYYIITTATHWAARIMCVRCIYYNMPLVVGVYPYMYNIYILYGYVLTQSDRLMSADPLSPRPRCELIEFYGRYHLPPAGGPGLQCVVRDEDDYCDYIISYAYIYRYNTFYRRAHIYAYYILPGRASIIII